MPKIEVYYDYYDGFFNPKWMIIYFGARKIDWYSRYIYVPLNTPFRRKQLEEFVDYEIALTITQVDLVMNSEKPCHFGIDLQRVLSRVNRMRGEGSFPYDINDISIFILQIADIEEILAMGKNELYSWR